MKPMSKKYALAMIVFLFAAAILCLLVDCSEPGPTNTDQNQIQDSLIVIDGLRIPESNSHLVKTILQEDTVILTYDNDSIPVFSPGDYVVGSASQGYLRKVLSVLQEGSDVKLVTEEATLSDVIVEGSFDTTIQLIPDTSEMQGMSFDSTWVSSSGRPIQMTLTSGNPELKELAEGFSLSIPNIVLELKTTDGQETVAARLKIEELVLDLDANVDIGCEFCGLGCLKRFRFVENENNALHFKSVEFTSSLTVPLSNLIKELPGPSITIATVTLLVPTPLGVPLPVVLTAVIDISYGVELALLQASNGSNVSGDITITDKSSIGGEYRDGTLTPIGSWNLGGSSGLTITPPQSLGLEWFVKPNLSVMVYGIAGPGIYVKPYAYFDVPIDMPMLDIGAGISGALNFRLKFLSQNIAEVSYTFADYRKKLVSLSTAAPIPTLVTPSDNANLTSIPQFDWTATYNAAKYRIQIDETPDFSSPIIDEVLSASELTDGVSFPQSGTYYWRVCALTIGGIWGSWTTAWCFHLQQSETIAVGTDFETGLDGWTVISDGTCSWQASAGNPGGWMRVDDNATGGHIWAKAPAKFQGDWRNYVSVTADVRMVFGTATETFEFRISGPGGGAEYKTGLIPTDSWQTFSAPLGPEHWSITSGSWDAIIQNVSQLLVEAEFLTGDEACGFDNVHLMCK